MTTAIAQAQSFDLSSMKSKKAMMVLAVVSVVAAAMFAAFAHANATDTAFAPLFTFFAAAATGNLTRAICLLGGIIGAGTAAVNGKILLAATGIGIAIFGALSPTIIGAFFTGAVL